MTDKDTSLTVTGNGDVLEPADGIIGARGGGGGCAGGYPGLCRWMGCAEGSGI